MTDTIFALASAYGQAGVAVIRVSGPAAQSSLKTLSGKTDFQARKAIFTTLINSVSRESIDHALVLFFENPASFTGEDVVEYQIHGGPAVIEEMLNVLAQQPDHRMALPGEFTRRAFENGKMDLTAAEAVADLVHAETLAQKQQALSQMGGALSKIYEDWREELKKSLAYLEADIDFPDEDLPDGVAAQVKPKLEILKTGIENHLNDNRRGERLRDGIQVAVIGAPNAGKSSLINKLAQRDVAIVSDQAGTTRDVIDVHLNLAGFPVILSDTAGLRPDQLGKEGQDKIESEGIRRALEKAEQADIRLLLFDASELPDIDEHTKALIDDTALVVFNKIDCHSEGAEHLKDLVQDDKALGCVQNDIIYISVENNANVNQLLDELVSRVKLLLGSQDTPSLTRQRHRDALEKCSESLSRACKGNVAELIAEDVRLAIRYLGQITGRVDVEDLLDVIFKDFCIGK